MTSTEAPMCPQSVDEFPVCVHSDGDDVPSHRCIPGLPLHPGPEYAHALAQVTMGNLTDDDLREEAARRGMTVVDAQEWARVRAIADGPTPATDEAACPTCGCPTECPEGLAEERDRLRSRIEGIVREVADARRIGMPDTSTLAMVLDEIRALLSADAEKAGA